MCPRRMQRRPASSGYANWLSATVAGGGGVVSYVPCLRTRSSLKSGTRDPGSGATSLIVATSLWGTRKGEGCGGEKNCSGEA